MLASQAIQVSQGLLADGLLFALHHRFVSLHVKQVNTAAKGDAEMKEGIAKLYK